MIEVKDDRHRMDVAQDLVTQAIAQVEKATEELKDLPYLPGTMSFSNALLATINRLNIAMVSYNIEAINKELEKNCHSVILKAVADAMAESEKEGE